jgi:hypothetical protein
MKAKYLGPLFVLAALAGCSEQGVTPAEKNEVSASDPLGLGPNPYLEQPEAEYRQPDTESVRKFSDDVEIQCAFSTLNARAQDVIGLGSKEELDAARAYFKKRIDLSGLRNAFNAYQTSQAGRYIQECTGLGIPSANECFGEYVPTQVAPEAFRCVFIHRNEFGKIRLRL